MGKLIPSPPPHALWSSGVEGTGKLPQMEGGDVGHCCSWQPLLMLTSGSAGESRLNSSQTQYTASPMGPQVLRNLCDEIQGEDGASIPPFTL